MREIHDFNGGSATTSTEDGCFPVKNPTTSYWRSQLHAIDQHRSTEELPTECDVAIIGSGMAGVSVAYHLTKDLKEGEAAPSIVMLEARQVCSGATGRNGGHTKAQVSSIQAWVKQYGLDAATEVLDFVQAQSYAIKRAVEAEGLDCEFELRRSFDIYLDEQDGKAAVTKFKQSTNEGQRWTKEADHVLQQHADQVTSMHDVKAAFSVPACSLWPYKFVTSLLSRLLDRDALNLQTNTKVRSVSTDADGFNLVRTNRGRLRAKKLVFATNGYTSVILPEYEGVIVPYRGTASHIKPKSPVSPHLSLTYNIRYRSDRVDYLNPRPDGGIVVGGAKWTFAHDRTKWYNNWDDSVTLPEARPHFESLMQTHFKGWADSGAHVDYLWTGIMGLTPDERPHIGRVPGSKNRYIMAGFNGGGMSMIFLSSKGLAKMIREDATYEESGLPGLFETTEARLKIALPLQ